jgi:hypothetical protein
LRHTPAHVLKHLLALGAAQYHQVVRQHHKRHVFNMRVISGQILDVAGHMLGGIGQPDSQAFQFQPLLNSLEAFGKLTVRDALFSKIVGWFTHFPFSPHSNPPSN